MGDGEAGGEDAAAFSRLGARYRAELQVHCYRLLGSFEASGELLAETLLRAWRERETFAGHATFRTWLYRVATHTCLEHLAARPRTPATVQPCPDTLLDQVLTQEPASGEVVAEHTIGLAFIEALQSLPPRQRAVLVLRDVLGWSARETAATLGVSVAAVNSALQRARPRVRGREVTETASSEGAEVLQLYVAALENADDIALAAVWGEAASAPRLTVPPDLRTVATRMNRQPAVALYARGPGGTTHRAHALDVLRVENGRIAEITVFGPGLFAVLGLPVAL
ncbi:sigma-70 family RNA polymerase sigma factor [Streptomyces paromomycinus]|uniref:RNA polymerase sigma factor n=1 Tax=Streptomyces paromomycinus TaxID=92743 RepID=A0A401VWT6_STREY|nr:sigma-70 family RNA polymerase sigma factor [Streptomyces paromomycinus]GCD41540.1 RNA polymerase sigma factor [Streptomyces paromomycinus]